MEEQDWDKSHRRARRQAMINRGDFNEWRPRSTVFENRRKKEERKECRRKVSKGDWEL
jgi:hypothetical protein